jgi:hypothetical protein
MRSELAHEPSCQGKDFELDRDGHEAGLRTAYILPSMAKAIADAAACPHPAEHLEFVRSQRFRICNPPEVGPASRGAAEAALSRIRQRIVRRERQLLRPPQTRTVTRPAECPRPRLYSVMGWAMLRRVTSRSSSRIAVAPAVALPVRIRASAASMTAGPKTPTR